MEAVMIQGTSMNQKHRLSARSAIGLPACLILVLLAAPAAPAAAAVPPPPPERKEIEAIIARSPGPAPAARARELKVLLLANPKDHGVDEHDYPLWQKRWAVLLGGKEAGDERQVNLYGPPPREAGDAALAGAPGVKVKTAWDWPKEEEFAWADLVVGFFGTGRTWTPARVEDLEKLLQRGGGFVSLHSACITNRELAGPLAERLGLAWQDGITTFRHGPVDLAIRTPDQPICLGLPARIHFEDESYWPLVGDREKAEVLATADEVSKTPDGGSGPAPQAMIWTAQRGKGRAFCSILGHYTWTFDDPYFRLTVLRGMAWAARESPFRFDPLVLRGARVREEGAAPAAAAAVKPSAAPKMPDPRDPRLILWLDASERSTLTVGADGGISDWSSKAASGSRGLTSSGSQRPKLVGDGPGGRPAARFDGKDDVLRDTGFRRAAKDWTLLLVAQPRSNEGGFRSFLAAGKSGVNDYLSGFNLDLGGLPSAGLDTINLEGIQHAGQSNLKIEAAPFGGLILAVVRGKGRALALVNGIEEGSRDSAEVEASLEEIRIGARNFNNSPGGAPFETGFLDGDISEVILFAAALPVEELSGISAYLEGKYGVARSQVRAQEPTLDEAFAVLPTFEITKGRRTLGPIDEAILASHGDAEAQKKLEERLLAVLGAELTRDAKDFICRRLLRIGSARSVPALAAMLPDPGLSYLARTALERIGGPEAAAALREALPRSKGKPREGVIDSLGRLGDRQSVSTLTALLTDGDAGTVATAAAALARMQAFEPLEALRKSADGPTVEAANRALLDLAARLLAEGKKDEAARIFKEQCSSGPEPCRIEALHGLARAAPSEARPLLEAAARSGSPALQRAAARILKSLESR
jgi:type 1 glutamine amidotransferase